MGPYSFRIPLAICLVACAARLLLDAPAWVPYTLGGAAVLYIGFFTVRGWIASRAFRRAQPIVPPAEGEDYEQCEVRSPLVPGSPISFRCYSQKGHEGEHEGSIRDGITWQ